MAPKEIFLMKLKRVVRAGFFNFWRNGTVSLASVLVMTVTLFVIGSIIFSRAVLDASITELRNKVDVNVTFVTTALEKDIIDIKQSLESLPEVSLVTYVSRDDVLERFKERHASDQSILLALDELGENPLGAVLNIKAKDPAQYASVADFLSSDNALSTSGVTIIDNVNYFENKIAIDKLSNIISAADKLGFALTLFLAVMSILIAFNTIRLTIYIAREEIGVMRLVGASSRYIQGPFVVVGVIYGLVASLFVLILFLPITYWLGDATANFFVGLNVFEYYLRNFVGIFFTIIISGVFIGTVSSFLAVKKYLRI